MMSFEEFIKEMEKGVSAVMGEGYDVTAQKVPKNNGVILTGLVIAGKGSGISPAIYLDALYQAYMAKQGYADLEAVVKSITETYWEGRGEAEQLHIKLVELSDYRKIKDKIAFKLINTEENKELLKQIPSVPFQDLSIVFFLFLEGREEGICTALIHNQHMELWGVTVDDLYQEAKENTPRLFPETLMGLDEVIRDLEKGGGDGEYQDVPGGLPGIKERMFCILTNKAGVGGAACLLYPGVIRKCSEKLDSDLLILPSSVHETLILPYDETIKAEDMRCMVQSINRSEVPVEDRLSGQVYVYLRSEDRVITAA